MMRWIGAILAAAYLVMIAVMLFYGAPVFSAVQPEQLLETRYCGVQRNTDGTLKRSSTVLTAFQRIHPCPSTEFTTGACPGWQKNHIIPLACGGCDAVNNLVWLPSDIKTCAGAHCVDRYERKISALAPPMTDTGNCINEVVQ